MSQKKQYPVIDERQPEELDILHSNSPGLSPEEQKAMYHYDKWAARKHSSNPYVLLALFLVFIWIAGYLLSLADNNLRYLGGPTALIGLACLVEALRKDARREAYIAGYKRGTFEVLKKNK